MCGRIDFPNVYQEKALAIWQKRWASIEAALKKDLVRLENKYGGFTPYGGTEMSFANPIIDKRYKAIKQFITLYSSLQYSRNYYYPHKLRDRLRDLRDYCMESTSGSNPFGLFSVTKDLTITSARNINTILSNDSNFAEQLEALERADVDQDKDNDLASWKLI